MKADAHRLQLAGAGNFDSLQGWFPNHLRHAAASRKRYGAAARGRWAG